MTDKKKRLRGYYSDYTIIAITDNYKYGSMIIGVTVEGG